MSGETDNTGLEIAVIGMSGRFPGAKNVEEFWNNLKDGVESITFFSHQELEEAGVEKEQLENPNYVKASGVLADIDKFDAGFFDYTPMEAETMDPQLRLFHEGAWEALEDAGYVPDSYNGLIGLYAGATDSFYWKILTILSGKEDHLGSFEADKLTNRDYLCARVAYKLNLKGPVVFMHTACSTSLIAIHMSCQGLLSGECDLALAGGVSIIPYKAGYIYQEGMVFSPDGRCRAFDDNAKGTLVGSGLGIVVLKRLEEAIEDRDHINAVIKGSSINNDGMQKVGFAAPSVEGQSGVIRDAIRTSQIGVESIGCIETHGTGTRLGDPIEFEALKNAFDTDKKGFCAIGSVKTNIGHLDAAAGVAGFIKTVLALQHKLIPPSLHFETPNQRIDLINSPFYVNASLREWENGRYPRRAGVSSMGIGGTNAHVILEEAPVNQRDKEATMGLAPLINAEISTEYHLILLSAKTQTALDKVTANLANYFKDHPDVNLTDVAYTLQVGRKCFKYRRMEVCSTVNEALNLLSTSSDTDSRKVHEFNAKEKELDINLINLKRENSKMISRDKYLLNIIGQSWLHGKKIDWDEFYFEQERKRIPLPPYPFERQLYRTEGNPFKIAVEMLQRKSILHVKPDITDWFYIPSWKRTRITTSKPAEIPRRLCWLIFIDECGLGKQLVTQLKKEAQVVITVKSGTNFLEENDHGFIINPAQEKHYHALFNELGRLSMLPDKILHLWSVMPVMPVDNKITDMEAVARTQQFGFHSLINIAKTIGIQAVKKKINIEVISNNLQEVSGGDGLCPEKASIQGPVKTIPTEYDNINCRSIDVILPRNRSRQYEKLVRQLLDEFISGSSEPVMAFRANYRWVKDIEPIRLENIKGKNLQLRMEGVYLVTGGLGGIGLALAQYLAKSVRAKLILTGRTALPARDKWERYLIDSHQDDPVKVKIQKIKELERLGSDVLAFSADVANQAQMKAVFSLARDKFGPINGIIHCAGIPDGALIQGRDRETSEAVFKAKINGTLVLNRLLKEMDPDFFIFCSSLNSFLPELGQVGYCAANNFLDSFAHYKNNSNGLVTISINWGRWQNVGIAQIAEDQYKRLTDQELGGGMRLEDGVEAFKRILADPMPQVAVSSIELRKLIKHSYNKEWQLSPFSNSTAEKTAPGSRFPRPQLDTEYISPGNELEQKLVDTWKRLFGFERVGIDDDFFELGGDSLKAIVILTKMHKELNVKIPIAEMFRIPTIRGLAKYIDGTDINTNEDNYEAIQPEEKKDYYILSSAQERLFFLQQMDLESTGYHVTNIGELEGELHKKKLEAAFRKLIARHESLRTSFEIFEHGPIARIQEEVKFEVEYMVTDTGGAGQDFLLEVEKIIDNFIRPFDLSEPPLLRIGLIATGREKHIIIMDMHHIISDFTSFNILMRDFMNGYGGKELPALGLQYKDYSEWQKSRAQQELRQQQAAFWSSRFSGELPVLHLPFDYPRPIMQSFQGSIITFELNENESKKLKKVAREANATIFMAILSIFFVLLSKLAGQEDIIIGTPIAGRNHAELENIVGMFVNTLALRNFPSGEKTYREFLQEVKEHTLEELRNQDYPFEELVDNVSVPRDTGRNPLFDVMLVFQNVEITDLEIPGLKLNPYHHQRKISKFDLTLTGIEHKDKINFSFEFCTKIFRKETIERYARYFKKIVSSVTAGSRVKISGIEIITWEEKQQVLYDFNDTASDYPGDKTIHRLFEEQVKRTPERIAVVGGWQLAVGKKNRAGELVQLTYRELHEKSHQLANVLKEKGAKSDTIVGLMVERSVEMIVGILGILKAGGAYLPIDSNYPGERIDYMLQDSGAKFLLAAPEAQVKAKAEVKKDNGHPQGLSLQMINLEADFMCASEIFPSTSTCQVSSANLAYIIYTSGSTGKPKGVMVQHGSLVNRLNWMQKYHPIGVGDVIIQKTSFTFDVSVWELLWWSLQGASVCLLGPGDEKDPEAIVKAVEQNRVTVMHFVPSMLNAFLDYLEVSVAAYTSGLAGLKQVFASGEALGLHHVQRFNALLYERNGTTLANLYGPTEATIDVSYFDCSTGRELEKIPIGKPIDNTQLYIVDNGLNLQPVGVVGELCIAGVGLARGYLNNPELTAEKFQIPHYRSYKNHRSYIPKKIYKTGDMARWLPDGNIDFLGRRDHQVKIRGFRVELGEIESQLLNHPGIKETVVVAGVEEGGDKYLCAYIVADRELSILNLRVYLSEVLPDYMLPSYFVFIEKVPLTPNGKIHRQALPAPELKAGAEYTAPGNWLEKKLVEIWADVLRIEKNVIGIDSNFFQLGGHSLKATIMAAKIHKELNVKLPLVEIFKSPNIRELALYIKGAAKDKLISIEVAEKKEFYALSSAQKRLYFLQQMDLESTVYHLPQINPLAGKADMERLEEALLKLLNHHESLRTSFHMIDEETVQRVHDEVEFEIEYYNLLEVEQKEVTSTIKSFIRPFDLTRTPLVRVGLMVLADQQYFLMVDMHHIISDGISQEILRNDFIAFYEGQDPAPLPIQYKDFSVWQNSPKQKETLGQQKQYWLNQFAGEIPVLNIPMDYPRPQVRSFAGSHMGFEINTQLTTALQRIVLEEKASFFMVLLAIFTLLLAKISGQEDIPVGTAVAGRRHADLEQVIGMFVNMLVIRSCPGGEKTFSQYLKEVKETSLAAFANQDYPFEALVEQVVSTRDTRSNPLFDAAFGFQTLDSPGQGTKAIPHPPDRVQPQLKYEIELSRFDLSLYGTKIRDHLYFMVEYSTHLFKPETIERFVKYFQEIVSIVVEDKYIKLKSIHLSYNLFNQKIAIPQTGFDF